MKYNDLNIDFKTKEISNNYDKIMETQNVFAGLEYLKMRASTIKQMQVINMIVDKLKGGEGDGNL